MKQSSLYSSIKYCTENYGYPVESCCKILHVSRSAYYKWLHGDVGKRVKQNIIIAERIEEIHMRDSSKGYRRIKDDLCRKYDISVNDKRVLRICRLRNIKSTIK